VTGKAEEFFELPAVCAFDCLIKIVSATHDSSIRINDRIITLEQSIPSSFQFCTRLASMFAEEVSLTIWIENEISLRIVLIAWPVSII
tara:strand:+ start:281 stop:544 length:264 start_codon:yes stop_codon:yes gene_type:complete